MKTQFSAGSAPSKAVIYCRVSTEEQVSNMSLSTQEEKCREYCQRHGLEVVGVYVEKGESAKTINRTEFQKMLRDYCTRPGKADALVVYSLSRFSRSTPDHYLIKNVLAKSGITLQSVTEPFDDSPIGQLSEGMVSLIAQFDNSVRAERTKIGMRAAVQAGRWVFPPPLGYIRGPKELGGIVPDPVLAPILKRAFEMVGTGTHTAAEALRHANKLGLRKSGRPVNRGTFHYTLRKRVYAGWIEVQKWKDVLPVQGCFAPIIDDDLFQKVQLILAGNTSTGKTHARSNPAFPLRRFIKCGACGTALTGSLSKGRKNRYAYYRCTKCPKVNIPTSKLEGAFCSHLDKLRPKEAFTRLFEVVVLDVWKNKQKDRSDLVTSLEKQKQLIETKRDKLVDAFVYKSKITEEDYNRERPRLDAEILSLNLALSDARIDELEIGSVISFANDLLRTARKLWLALAGEQREKLQWVLFPQGLSYLDGNFGTSVTASAFEVIRMTIQEKSTMATRHGLEP